MQRPHPWRTSRANGTPTRGAARLGRGPLHGNHGELVIPVNGNSAGQQRQRLVGRRVSLEAGDPLPDPIGSLAAQYWVDEPVEFLRELVVGEGVLVVPGGER